MHSKRGKSVFRRGCSLSAVLAIFLFIPLFTNLGLGQALFGPNFVDEIQTDKAKYFRLKVSLKYKGEKQDFDIVVACSAKNIFYKDGSSTFDPTLIPNVFGRKMSDGKGLIIRPPYACHGQTTENGRVPQDFLPVIVVYDDANTLEFGTAYLSEDAYENPLSVLKFGGATIETATSAEFDAFRHQQTNLLTRSSFFSAMSYSTDRLAKMGLVTVSRPWGSTCKGYKHFLFSEAVRDRARQHWPADHPHYWIPTNGPDEQDILKTFFRDNSLRSDDANGPLVGWRIGPPEGNEANDGLPTRSGGGVISSGIGPKNPTHYTPAAIYPASTDDRRDLWPADPKDWLAYINARPEFADVNLDLRDGITKGLAYCFNFPTSASGQFQGTISSAERPKRIAGRVDGLMISTVQDPGGGVPPHMIFDRDVGLYSFIDFALSLHGGDL